MEDVKNFHWDCRRNRTSFPSITLFRLGGTSLRHPLRQWESKNLSRGERTRDFMCELDEKRLHSSETGGILSFVYEVQVEEGEVRRPAVPPDVV